MSQNLSFHIKFSPDETVKLEQEATFENFIGQFQLFCSKLLCVVDGTYLRYYSKRHELPTNIRFDYKQRQGKLTEYYFRDIDTNTLYCIFGRDCAKIFYPRIDEVDPDGMRESLLTPAEEVSKPTSNLVASRIARSIPADTPISQSVEKIPIPRPTIERATIERATIERATIERTPIAQPIAQPPIERATIERTPISQPIERPIQRQPSGRPVPRPTIAQPTSQSDIIITDRRVRMTFPNPNYPVVIKIYQPL